MSDTDSIAADLFAHIFKKYTPLVILNNWKPVRWEMDLVVVMKDMGLIEYEIKISRGDFLREARDKERKHTYYASVKSCRKDQLWGLGATPQKFYYVCPEGMIQPSEVPEVPEWAGLIYWYKNRSDHFRSFKRCSKLHGEPIDEHYIKKIQTSMCFRLGKNLRDIAKLKGKLNGTL